MTNRDAPARRFGSDFPFGSAVTEKFRFFWYSVKPTGEPTGKSKVPKSKSQANSQGGFSNALGDRVHLTWDFLRGGGCFCFHWFGRCDLVTKGLTHQITSKASDNNVLAKSRDLTCNQLVYGLIRVLNETLLHQTNCAVKLVHLPCHDLGHNVLRFSLHLCFIDRAFRVHQLFRDIFTFYEKRMGSGNMESDVLHQFAKAFILCHEIGLAIHFDQNANLAL